VVSAAIVPALGGCAEAPAGGAWVPFVLATAAAAAGGFLLGAWRSRLDRTRAAAELQRCRAERQAWGQLQADWTWETDAGHRLLAWRGPGELPRQAPTGLFDAGTAPSELAAVLQARQPFAGLRLRAAAPVDGSVGWELRGAPRHDDLGGFAGFAGRARPTDGDDGLRADAAALGPALAAQAEPAFVLQLRGPSRLLRHANAAALTLWPGRAAAGDGDAAWAALPSTVRSACQDLAAGDSADVDGWRVCALAGPRADDRHLLLVRHAVLPAGLAAAAQSSEGDSFSFTVTHDLRAPIRVVEGFTRIVKEDYGRLLDRVGNDHLDRVLGAAARMNLMIDALLTLARLSTQPLERQPVNLSQLAGWVVEDLRRATPARAAEVEIEPGLAAQGDPTLLRQLLENLLGNAWKYSAQREPARISLRRLPHDARTVFVVRDNGAGFDMRGAERLFGLFQRLHSASDFAGHGVGLASVRRIVRRHGGEVWAEAEPGRGAAFFFTLG
jgi:signal transduction histidine kinase